MRRGVLELLVFDQLADQFPAGVLAVLFGVNLRLLLDGQQFPAFDIHQRGGHHQKLAGDFQVQHPHRFDVFNKLGGQLREIDFVNVHLLLLDQVKEQIKRAFKDLEFDLIFSHSHRRLGLTPGR